jgi:hypothetical protein
MTRSSRSHRAVLAFLVALLLGTATVTHAAEAKLRVSYAPPLITVEAQGVTLPVLLREIGRQAGFEVVGPELPRTPISLEVRDVVLDNVLRQLLRGEDHVIVYRGGAGAQGVDTVVLRGPQGPASSRSRVAVVPDRSFPTPPVTTDPTVVGGTAGPMTPPPVAGLAPGPGAGQDAESQQAIAAATVRHLLESQALATQLPAQLAGAGAAPIPGGAVPPAPAPAVLPPPTPPPADTTRALAEMTQAAQQNLKALMDQLDVATESMRAAGTIAPR